MKRLDIEIEPDGNIKFDLSGYTDKSCEKDLQTLGEGISTGKKLRKPEYYNKVVDKVKVLK